MSDIAIRVDNLSKLYHLGVAAAPRHAARALTGIFRRVRPSPLPLPTISALKDVSFEVKRGEVTGTSTLASGCILL
ncbi:MAG: hypothetical protein HZY76_19970 [Anaerolineae bacterium]|nr:MAG: hypothetical protein HZY76_19970 [Anaerolineae bacterium]